MSFYDFARIYEPTLTNEEIHFLLWEWTAYPANTLSGTVKQLMSAIRMHKNKRNICWECNMLKELGHRKTCSSYEHNGEAK
jgi:hypothetical protein